MTGVVYAFVESLSMAVGSFLSEEAGEEYTRKRENISRAPVIASVIMFFSFLISSFISTPSFYVFIFLILHYSVYFVLYTFQFLKITGRLKEQFKTENGKYIVPAPLEVSRIYG